MSGGGPARNNVAGGVEAQPGLPVVFRLASDSKSPTGVVAVQVDVWSGDAPLRRGQTLPVTSYCGVGRGSFLSPQELHSRTPSVNQYPLSKNRCAVDIPRVNGTLLDTT